MRRSFIVCFTGIDGSGKTSHAYKLLKALAKKGVHCRYAWCRWSFGFASMFHFIIRKIFGYTKENYACARSSKVLQKIFEYLILFDLSISILFKVKIPSFLGSWMIVDRYVYDLLADLIFWGFDFSNHDLFPRLMIQINPKPHLTFLIDVPVEVACRRRKELSKTEATEYQRIYENLAKSHNFEKIANLNFRETHNEILKRVMEFVHNTSISADKEG